MASSPSLPGTDRWVPGRRSSIDSSAGVFAEPVQPVATSSAVRPDWFDNLDLADLTDAALSAAAGAEHADVRITNSRTGFGSTRDGEPAGSSDDIDAGLSVRVVLDGCWGFAASQDRSPHSAADTARRAVSMARSAKRLTTRRVELATEPVHRGSWESPHETDPFSLSGEERMDLLTSRAGDLKHATGVDHSEGRYLVVRERVHYADLAGSFIQQQRVRVEAEWTAHRIDPATGDLHSMRTVAPPVGRGWEFVVGGGEPVGGSPGWDWQEELLQMPELLAQKAAAPAVEPGTYDLVLDPSHLWLTIHESVGHATELDRALGYEANYAGTTFATPEKLGSFGYGSDLMTITADRTARHGLSSVAWDDEGVAAQAWDLVRDGTFVGYQRDRAMTAEFGIERSNGCAYADSAGHVPIQRMPNISLAADPAGGSMDDLIASVERGILILGDNSWSIDMQRYNFQFTGQRFWQIKDGAVVGQLRDVAYQSSTPQFWASLAALGGPGTYMLGGAINCGKGQPAQVAAVSHGAPAALFRNVKVLNTSQEAHR